MILSQSSSLADADAPGLAVDWESALLASWIAGYFLAVLLSRGTGAVCLLFLPLVLSFRIERQKVFVALAGIVWGLVHAGGPPVPNRSIAHCSSARHSLLGGSFSQISCSGGYFEVMRVGEKNLQTVGVSCLNKGSLLLPRQCWARSSRLPRNDVLPQQISPWHETLLFGRKSAIEKTLKTSLQQVGLFHLCVVSGLHIAILAMFLNFMLMLPVLLLYSLRLLSPVFLIHANVLCRFLTLVILGIYCVQVGFPPPTQRAFLLCTSRFVLETLCGKPSRMKFLSVALAAQILLFPVGLVSVSGLMSWTAYLIVAGTLTAGSTKGFIYTVLRLVKMQVLLAVAGFVLFGSSSLVGVFANLVFVPVFPIFLALAWLSWVVGGVIGEMFDFSTRMMEEVVIGLADLESKLRLCLPLRDFFAEHTKLLQILGSGLLALKCLNIISAWSISSERTRGPIYGAV